MTAEEYRALLAVDFGDVELGSLTDISKIRIDKGQPLEKRRQQYLKKVGNPYLVRVGNMKVKVRFADNGVSMEEAFEKNAFIRIKNQRKTEKSSGQMERGVLQ